MCQYSKIIRICLFPRAAQLSRAGICAVTAATHTVGGVSAAGRAGTRVRQALSEGRLNGAAGSWRSASLEVAFGVGTIS